VVILVLLAVSIAETIKQWLDMTGEWHLSVRPSVCLSVCLSNISSVVIVIVINWHLYATSDRFDPSVWRPTYSITLWLLVGIVISHGSVSRYARDAGHQHTLIPVRHCYYRYARDGGQW